MLIKLSAQELEQYREKEKSSSSKHYSSLVEETLDDEIDSDTEMEVVTIAGDAKAKVNHDLVMKAETGMKQSQFFKSKQEQVPNVPLHGRKDQV